MLNVFGEMDRTFAVHASELQSRINANLLQLSHLYQHLSDNQIDFSLVVITHTKALRTSSALAGLSTVSIISRVQKCVTSKAGAFMWELQK